MRTLLARILVKLSKRLDKKVIWKIYLQGFHAGKEEAIREVENKTKIQLKSLKEAKRKRIKSQRRKLSKAKKYRVFKRDSYTCYFCGEMGDDLTVDHIVPISRGGSNDPANLITACKTCNKEKGNLSIQEFLH